MDYKGFDIKSLSINNDTITVTYSNDQIEIIPKNSESYLAMYYEWILDNPVFITDIYKDQMHHLFFAGKNHNQDSINFLNTFFSSENIDEALKFINYMRTRDLTEDRKKWTHTFLKLFLSLKPLKFKNNKNIFII